MALPRFFLTQQTLADESSGSFPLRLDEDDLKHFKVLRLGPGEHVAVVDADGVYYECEIESVDAGEPRVSIASRPTCGPERPRLTLIQGLAKGEKMDEAMRHAAELGVAAFIPYAARRSVVKLTDEKAQRRLQRWQTIVKSAAMQSGQDRIATVSPPLDLPDLLRELAAYDAVFICWEEADTTSTLQKAVESIRERLQVERLENVAVVVGPEGGLEREEVEAMTASAKDGAVITLGPSILRTETAAVVAAALVLYELERETDRR